MQAAATHHHAANRALAQALISLCLSLMGGAVAEAATVAGGASHTLVLRTTDGSLWAWGANSDGQLADNTTTQRKTPIQVTSLTSVAAVAAGAKHSLALRSDGTLWAFGDNYYGQLGNGNNTDQKVPVQVMTGVVAIAAGEYHSVVLKADATVWTWGLNSDGQLGDGSTTNRNTPVQVSGLGLVTAVAAGARHSLAVLLAGTMSSWGKNSNGQLGVGSTYARSTSPVSVIGVTGAVAASGGTASSVVRVMDGTLYAFGYNGNGHLGFGDTTQRPTPTLVPTIDGVALIASGAYHTAALGTESTLDAWGHNLYGSVGDGTTTQRTSPEPVVGLADIIAVSSGEYHNVAVTSTGEVWTWGRNNQAQLGDGTTTDRSTAVKIAEAGFAWKVGTPTLSPAPNTYSSNQNVTLACVTAGATIHYTVDGSDPTEASPTYSSAIPVTASQTIKARAFASGLDPSNVAFGTYTLKVSLPAMSPSGGTYSVPQTVTISTSTSGAALYYTTDGSDPSTASNLYAGPFSVGTTTVLKAAGFKTGWSQSDVRTGTFTMNFGTLPAPSFDPPPGAHLDSLEVTIDSVPGAEIHHTTDGSTPTLASGLYVGPVGLSQTTTLKAKAWAADYQPSAVTSGTYTIQVAAPTLSLVPGSYPAGTTVTVASITAGATIHYTLNGGDPRTADPTIASGSNLVLGNYTLKAIAFKTGCLPSAITAGTYSVTGETTEAAVAAGGGFSLVLRPDGTVWAFGDNASGRLGDGATADRLTPAPISALTGVVAIAAGSAHGLALTGTGTVMAWGLNSQGQLGDATTTTRTLPIEVPGLSGVVAIAAGDAFSLALESDGTLYAFGANQDGQLGTGDTTSRLGPVQVMTGVAEAAAGWRHTIVRKGYGTVWSFGDNASGQLGDGTTTDRWSPVEVTSLPSVTHAGAGGDHSLALGSDGVVRAWGRNTEGALGDGTTTVRLVPTSVVDVTAVTRLEAGYRHSLAIDDQGAAWAFGYNNQGQIGEGTTTNRNRPVLLVEPTDVARVSGGLHHSIAMTTDGSVYAWGDNTQGQLGDGTTVDRLTPVKISEGDDWRVATPTLSPNGGSFQVDQSVVVDDLTPGATIRYTTNGSDPTESDPVVAAGGTVLVDRGMTLKARAWKAGMPESGVASTVFAMTVPTPAVSPTWGTFNVPQTATVTCALAGAQIHYTRTGLDPTPSDPVVASGGTIAVNWSQTLKARAFRDGWADSGTNSQPYTLVVGAPSLTPGAGSYGTAPAVTVATTTPAATLNYTLDGREPSAADPVVASGGALLVDRSLTLRVKGHRSGWTDSSVASASYYLSTGAVAAPTLSPGPGSYVGPQAVSVWSGTPGAAIRYTTDGSEPGPTSPLYVGPVTLDTTATLMAKAFRADLVPSPTTSGAYTIDNPGAVATPVFTPLPGRYAAKRDVTVSSATPGATLRYSTDGADPVPSDPQVASGSDVLVDRAMVLRAKGWKDGLDESGVRSGFYLVTGALSATSTFALALKADGTVVGWGSNGSGQLGDGTTVYNTSVPVTAAGLGDVVAVATGYLHSVALRADGTVFTWGANSYGQLGDGTTTGSLVPKAVPGLGGVVAIAAGLNHTLAVKADGTAWAWGRNLCGMLGDGTSTLRTSPVPVSNLSDVTSVAAGADHTLAVTADERVWAWGCNGNGALGDGTTTASQVPTPVTGLTGVSQVWAASSYSLALKTDGLAAGSLWGWGKNVDGQLATGDTSSRTTPVKILGGVTDAAVGTAHTLAIKDDGSLWAWGRAGGSVGRLGDGANVSRFAPVQVWGLRDAVAVAAGDAFSAAIRADGSVFAWGYNLAGTDLPTPAQIPNLVVAENSWLGEDGDNDELSAYGEWRSGCDPLLDDTNGDGIRDGTSVALGVACWNPDIDGDGVSNPAELASGTSPWSEDTDGDGLTDGLDCAPLDPARTSCPVDPDDHTPPVITILEPPNAIALP